MHPHKVQVPAKITHEVKKKQMIWCMNVARSPNRENERNKKRHETLQRIIGWGVLKAGK
jgi:hypothetical protein